ncbi:unnamed protein product [Coregonus sp. 'balchen']|nr:unnamed protein product [Coregonus sp. 'balchen']
MDRNHKRLRRILLKAGTLQARPGEQVLQTDVHATGHDGLRLPALNLVPKPPHGPRPSREANMAKAEKKAREAIKARRAREAKAGVKKPSHQVVGVLPAIKKGTKVTKVETTGPVTPEDGEIMISFPSVDDPLTPKSDVTSEAERNDASHPISPEEFSPTDYLKSHPCQRKLIRKFLKQMNMTIGDLDKIIKWVVCVSNEVFLPAMALHRTSSPESSDSSRWASGVLQIISEKFHQRSSELRERLLGGQPPTPPSETDEELQGTADLFVSNILKRVQENLFSSGEDDLEKTNPGITLTEERLSTIFSELFRDACESAALETFQEGEDNSWSSSGSSQGSRWFNLYHQAKEMESFDLQRDPLCSSVSVGELGSVRRPKGRDVHKALSEGSLPVFALLGERPGVVGETSSPAGEMDETQTASTPSLPRSGHGGRRSSQTTTPTTGHREAGVTASNIFDVINHLTHSDTDRELNLEFSSEDDVSLNDIMDMKFTPAVEPLGQILSSWRLVNRIFRGKVHYFGKELICKVYQMLLDTGMGRRPMARQSRSEPILKDLAANRRLSNELFTDVLYMFIQRTIKNLLENFLGLPTTPPEELWDSDSSWSRGLREEEGAEPLGRWAAQLERDSSLTLQSSGSLSDDNKEALGMDSGARDRFPDTPCSSSPKDEEEVVVSVMTVSYPKPSTSTQAAWTLDVLLPRPCQDEEKVVPNLTKVKPFLDEEEVVPSTSMKDDYPCSTGSSFPDPGRRGGGS